MTQTCYCLIRLEWQNNLGLCDLLLEFYVLVLFGILSKMELGIYEPRREKTGLRGFRPGLTQTGLYSHRSRLEA